LVPPALEEEKIRKQKEAELAAKTKELQKQEARLQEERLRKEKEEKEVQEQMERAEREEREASERAAAENQAAADQERAVNEASANVGASGETQEEGEAMEGVERTDPEVPETLPTENTEVHDEAGPSEPAERIRATFRGREVDITDLGIDLEYLNALPDELREEVLMSRLAEQRSQVGATGTEVTDNSPEFREFLEALPTEIREELLQQEASNHRRREREENRRRAAASGGPAARAEDMDPASFLASLDPHLRNAVLLEQDEEVLAHLPEAIRREAQNLVGDRPMHRWTDRLARVPNPRTPTERQTETITKKTPRRPIVQMLDKAGVATLLRLLFVPQQGSSRQSLNQILHHVSQNRQNRAEIVNILLSILQDGSADASAVERSFLQLSLRAKHPATQKTPQPPKRTLTGPLSTPPIAEMTPLMVIQQCLSALVHLTELNPHIPLFFLTEHEPSGGMRLKAFKKGKGKETRAAKFAVNGLLSLLDRKLIMESGGCMEQLSTLLQSVTHPLTMLLRKEKDKPVQAKNDEGGEPASTASAQEEARVGSGALNPAGDEGPGTGIENVGPVEEDVNMDDRSPTLLVAQPSTTNSSADINTAATRPVLAPTSEVVSTDAPGEAKLEGTQEPESEESSKKPRALTAPIVPEENLRLVVNILAARECSAKPFRDALGTINNLSAIPGAKAVFGRELIKQAQGLGETISGDLDALVAQILKAETETDVQGMALTKFSPSSSDQAKLLRVLTALNYLFDPSRNGGRNRLVLEASSSDEEAKEDLLSTAYDNATFGSLWDKLSECLTCISKRDNMINVATILLPLVEALMVVCKNTTLKEAPIMKPAKEFSVTSPPPESRMENLFFRFTEDHRKILNDLVRHNPRLMSGTFSLLVNNPKVLEFDNKRNYFTRRLHSRTEARQSQPPLQLTVRRDQVFLDSFRSLLFKSPDEMKFGKLSIRFTGEEGVDAGGVTREWFQAMSRQMFNGDYALFIPVASDRTTFHPSTLSYINEEHLRYFKVVGRIIGKALYEGRALDCHFSRAVYKRILGKPVSIKDMETLDLDYYKSLVWMLENDIADIITETFSIETDVFGNTEIVDLVENGRNIPVTEENKQEYVQLVVEHRLTGSVKTQLEEFLKGICSFRSHFEAC
jgi:E3 ubiquitin-protein ligase HUWE1